MQSVPIRRRRQAAIGLCLMLLALAGFAGTAAAQSLFGKQVEVTLAARDGKPMAGAEVRVFAPGNLTRPATTGKTDSDGKFYFSADRDGVWTAEATQHGEVARVSVEGRGVEGGNESVSPWLLVGLLIVLLAIAVAYRILRTRSRRPRA